MSNIPSHLIECPIDEATCVVNARGEEFKGKWSEPIQAFDIGKYAFQLDVMAIGCLTPCKPKPVFTEAVSVTKFVSLDEAISNPKQKIAYGKDNAACFYFNPADLTGIENIPPDQLEIVLRVKKVSE